MSDLAKLTIVRARVQLRAGDLTAGELTEACLAEVEGARALNASYSTIQSMAGGLIPKLTKLAEG